MFRVICEATHIAVNKNLERVFVPSKQCFGLSCKPNRIIESNSVIAIIPFSYCIAPIIAIASPWGQTLQRALREYDFNDDKVQVKYDKNAALITAFTALASRSGSPLFDYLHFIEVSNVCPDHVLSLLSDAEKEKLHSIEKLTHDFVLEMCTDLNKAGINVSEEEMMQAQEICSSRCLDIPESDNVFGGPAVVPVVDLINHDDEEANIKVRLMSERETWRLSEDNRKWICNPVETFHVPYYVVVQANKDIESEEELHYKYIDIESDKTEEEQELDGSSEYKNVGNNALF